MDKRKVKISLPYGVDMLEAEISTDNLILDVPPDDLPGLTYEKEAFKEALSCPIGTPPLMDLVKKGGKAVIVVDDITRPTPTKKILRWILTYLSRGGISKEDITILVALGLHRPLSREEMRKQFGDTVVEQYRVVNHDPWSRQAMTYLGKSKSGNKIWLNSILAEADVKILTGLIRPHPVFGYTGGRKSILPGVSDSETVLYNHRAEWHAHEVNCDNLVLEDNPAHLDALDIAKKVGVDFIVNVVLNQKKEIAKVIAGDLEKAWLEGVAIVKKMSLWEVSERADILISSPGGHPNDMNLYQSIAIPTRKRPVFKEGATIIVTAQCPDGIGNSRMFKLLTEAHELHDVVKNSQQRRIIDYELASYAYAYFMKKYNLSYIALIEGVSKKDLKNMFIESAASLQEAVDRAFQIQGANARVLVLPNSKNIIPRIKQGDYV